MVLSLKPETHRADIKEQAATKADCFVTSPRLRLANKPQQRLQAMAN